VESTTGIDRGAAVRRALRVLVAERGFHGASMNAIAAEAGVATGTAYTYYPSKDEVVLAAYRETKAELAAAAVAGLDATATPAERFRSIWIASYRHLAANPDHAVFLLQVDSSPYREPAHASHHEAGEDPMMAQAGEILALLLPLPLDVLYELALAPAVRLAAAGAALSDDELELVAAACWRAISAGPGG
jgi:AcrR family transcriptional regulator